MKKVLFLLLTLTGCSVYRNDLVINIKETGFGLCETQEIRVEKMDSSPSNSRTISENFKLIKQTNKIPAHLGESFGIEYIITASKTRLVQIEQVWIFPKEIIDKEQRRFKEVRYNLTKLTNEKTYATYRFDKEYEMVKGTWIFQIRYNDSLKLERKFLVE